MAVWHLETLRPLAWTASKGVRRDVAGDLSAYSGANLVSRAEVNSRIDPRVNNLIEPFAKRVPLTRDARNCGGNRHARSVPEYELEDRCHGSTVRCMSRNVFGVPRRWE